MACLVTRVFFDIALTMYDMPMLTWMFSTPTTSARMGGSKLTNTLEVKPYNTQKST